MMSNFPHNRELINIHEIRGWPGRVFEYNEMPSTDVFLFREIEHFRNMDVIFVHHQTSGHGRGGSQEKTWFSPDRKGLTFSILCRMLTVTDREDKNNPAHIEKANTLLQVVCWVWNTIFHQMGLSTIIKWPNDILYQDKKIAGFSMKSIWRGQELFVSLGMGINVYLQPHHLEIIPQKATSLSLHIKIDLAIFDLLTIFLQQFIGFWEVWLTKGFEPFVDSWKKNSNIFGKVVTVIHDHFDHVHNFNEKVKVLDMDKQGQLIVLDDKGQKKKISFGKIWTG